MKKILIVGLLIIPNLFASRALSKVEAANGAVSIAKWLHVNQEQDRAACFLRYAFARDYKNRSALLFQAKSKKMPHKINADEVTLEEIDTFKDYLYLVATKGKTKDIRLLHYRLLFFIDENHQESLTALTAARKQKLNTDYHYLHSKVFGQTVSLNDSNIKDKPDRKNRSPKTKQAGHNRDRLAKKNASKFHKEINDSINEAMRQAEKIRNEYMKKIQEQYNL